MALREMTYKSTLSEAVPAFSCLVALLRAPLDTNLVGVASSPTKAKNSSEEVSDFICDDKRGSFIQLRQPLSCM